MDAKQYVNDPVPAKDVLATLCNLNRDYFQVLRGKGSGEEALTQGRLRMAVVALDDNLTIWEGLRGHTPGSAADLDRAQRIAILWKKAVVQSEEGDQSAALATLATADKEVNALPQHSDEDVVSCQS